MINAKLETMLNKRRYTLLGVGSMSKNITDAVIEISNKYDIYIMLVASR